MAAKEAVVQAFGDWTKMVTQGVGVGQVATAAVVAQATEVSALVVGFVRTASAVMRLVMGPTIQESEVSVQVFVVSVQAIEVSAPVRMVALEVSAISQGSFPLFVVPWALVHLVILKNL